jgi:hypothetical protein
VAQQGYISTNYTFVARDMAAGHERDRAGRGRAGRRATPGNCPVSSNPDVVFELVERFAAEGVPLLKVGVVNRQMPFMPNGAAVAPGFFDIVVTDPAATHTLFGRPTAR